jgi:hypothetical protein
MAQGDDDGLNNVDHSSDRRKMNRFMFDGTRVSICRVSLLEMNFLIGYFNVSILIHNFLNPFPRIADRHVKQPVL